MADPLLHEPFLSRQPPRCLTAVRGDADGASNRATSIARRAEWPLRANFQHWALKVLTIRSSNGG